MAAGADLLRIQSPIQFDETIAQYDVQTYMPYSSMSFANNDEIRIVIGQSDLYVLPSKSSIRVCGRLLKADETGATARTNLVNNAICHLFQEVKYFLNSVEIDCNKNPGITSLMKNLVSSTPSEKSLLENANFIGVAETNKMTNAQGYFDICLPLSKIFGFAEDYNRIIINSKHELVLIRTNTDNNAVIQSGEEEDFKIKISKVEWLVPQIKVNDDEKLNLLKFISKNKPISMSFRSWELMENPLLQQTQKNVWVLKTSTQLEKPRFIILGLQTARKNSKVKNASQFDQCGIQNVKVFLNSQSYPYGNINNNFTQNEVSVIYEMYCNFQRSYYGKEPKPLLSRNEFVSYAPIIVLDTSFQNEKIKSGSVDIRLELETAANIPGETSAFALIIHDRIVEYNVLNSVVRKL